MKKIFYSICAGVLMSALCVGVTACNDGQDPESQGENVPFSVYSPGENASGEKISNLEINMDQFRTPWGEGKIFIVNSNEELEKHIEEGMAYPSFDFSTKTLLLVGGGSFSSPTSGTIRNFQRFPDGTYKLKLEITQGMFYLMNNWCVAILTDKINSESKIELDITTIY